MVSPARNGNYELLCYGNDDGDDDVNGCVAPVLENTWYSVTIFFNWTARMVRVELATSVRHIGEKHSRFDPSEIDDIHIYNFSPSVSRYSGLEVLYPPAAYVAASPPANIV